MSCLINGSYCVGYRHGYAFGRVPADQFSVAASIPVSEVGTANDTLNVSAAITLPDGGACADALAGVRVFAESGAGIDTATVEALLELLDSGGGSDGPCAVAGIVDLTEAGMCADGTLQRVGSSKVNIITQAVLSGVVSLQVTPLGSADITSDPAGHSDQFSEREPMISPNMPFSDELRAKLVREEAIEDARDRRAAEKRQAAAEARYDGIPASAFHSPSEAILAAEAGHLPRTPSSVLHRVAAAQDREDYEQAVGRHRRDCGCDRCVIGRIGATQDADLPPTRPPWLLVDD